jgi:hypothetical protein
MHLLDSLLERAVTAIPERFHARVVVFGSAPMVFAGLEPDVACDLDLFVDLATYRALLDAGFAQDHDERGLPRVMVAEAVEVVSARPGVAFEEVLAASAPREGSRGLRVAALEHVLAWRAATSSAPARDDAELVVRAEGSTVRGAFALAVAPGTKAAKRDRAIDALLAVPLADAAEALSVVLATSPSAYAYPLPGKDEAGRTRFAVRGRVEGGTLVPERPAPDPRRP